jgi:hypothetical protein
MWFIIFWPSTWVELIFPRGVDRDDADAADDFRVVCDFLRAKQQAAAEAFEVVVDPLQNPIRDGE